MGKYEKYRGVSRHVVVGGLGYRRVLGPMAIMAERKAMEERLAREARILVGMLILRLNHFLSL